MYFHGNFLTFRTPQRETRAAVNGKDKVYQQNDSLLSSPKYDGLYPNLSQKYQNQSFYFL